MKLSLSLEQARAIVRQFVWNGTDESAAEAREAIAVRMVDCGECVLHASWELFGRSSGKPCYCSPCMRASEASAGAASR